MKQPAHEQATKHWKPPIISGKKDPNGPDPAAQKLAAAKYIPNDNSLLFSLKASFSARKISKNTYNNVDSFY